MKEELYELYKSDPDFKEYVDKYCKKHDLGVFEALNMKILESYGNWLKGAKKDRV